MKNGSVPPSLCFLLQHDTSNASDCTYGHTTLVVRGWDSTTSDLALTWVLKTPWHGFKIMCQYDDRTRETTYGFHYGFTLQHRDIILLQDAQRAYKTLSALDRRLDKMQSTLGHYNSFGELCVRLALATGITRLVWQNPRTTLWDTTTDQTTARHMINQHIHAWHASHNSNAHIACVAFA